MRLFRNISIRRKLVFIIMLISGSTLLLASLAFVAIDVIRVRKSLVNELSSQAEILAYNSTAALTFNDKDAAKEILAALKYRQSIIAACIFDQEGKVFEVYNRDQPIGELIFPQPQKDDYHFENRHLHLFHKIVLDREVLGTVYIRSDLRQIVSVLNQYSTIGVVVLILAAFIAYLLSSGLQRVISVPIIQLAKVTRTISSEKNYSVRAEKRSEDELGDLVEAFNEMVSQIQDRDTALRSEHDYSTGIINGTPAIILGITPDGTTTFINLAGERITGYSAEELIDRNWWEMLYPGDKQQELAKLFREFEKSEMRDYEMNLATKSGDIRTISWNSIHRFDQNGKITEIIGIGNDVTERKRAEEELQKHREHLEELVKKRTSELEEKATELEQANIRLQELDRLKSIFLASMSHELRTPLNSIIGFTGIILMGMSGEVNEEQKKQLTLVKNSATHLLSLINDILDISKIEAGRAEVSLEEFELDDVVREVVESSTPAVNEKGLEFITELPEDIILFSDVRRMKQILLNLTNNAIKFTDQGSVKIAARISGDGKLQMSVMDTGIGIKEEDMKKLFMPFQQLDVSLTKQHEGTGLGLSLTKKLVALLGGDISAKSEYGKGSEFTFVIPLKYEEE